VNGEPIVETPDDALWCLLSTELDCVAFADRIVHRHSDHRTILYLLYRSNIERVSIHYPRAWRGRRSERLLVTRESPRRFDAACWGLSADDVADRISKGQPYARLEVASPWGRVAVFCEPGVLELVGELEGAPSGREIFERATPHLSSDFDEPCAVRLLGALCRYRVLTAEAVWP
jgi:hypothetical protein